MNERIVELAKQAHFYQADDNYFTAAQEEFARLIVKECCQALHPMLRDQISRGQGVDLIKQHFGVEE